MSDYNRASALPFRFTVSVRCTACYFWRDWHTDNRNEAEAQRDEWANEHAGHSYSLTLDDRRER